MKKKKKGNACESPLKTVHSKEIPLTAPQITLAKKKKKKKFS